MAKKTKLDFGSEGKPPSLVKLYLDKNRELLGGGERVEALVRDEALFSKRRRRARCQLCERCQVKADCGECRNCAWRARNAAQASRRVCARRQCSNLVEQYDLRDKARRRKALLLCNCTIRK